MKNDKIKITYSTPKLTVYGNVSDLTRGTGTRLGDSGSRTRARRP